MRILGKTLVTLAVTGGVLVAATAPAAALTTCPGGEPVCVYVPAGSYPVGNPVVLSNGTTVTYVELPRVCDSTGTDCIRTFVAVPGAWVDSNGGTVATLDFPGLGVGINGTQVTLYASPPTLTPTGGGLGLTVSVAEDSFVVVSNQFDRECDGTSTGAGPVGVTSYACIVTVTLSV